MKEREDYICKHMITSRHPNSVQIVWIPNESFENIAKFKYFGTTLTNKN
jgi:hypothetical protein